MERREIQDTNTGVISLGVLANKLEIALASQAGREMPIAIDDSVFDQWKDVLEETIIFIQTAKPNSTIEQPSKTRFLARGDYLEQIYTAAPEANKDSLEELATYLQSMSSFISKASKKEITDETERSALSQFARSIASGCISEASKFHREPHFLTKRSMLLAKSDAKTM